MKQSCGANETDAANETPLCLSNERKERKIKFALVSLTKGEDKDALSIVPVYWIVDFDPQNCHKDFLVECCNLGGKRPTNGC